MTLDLTPDELLSTTRAVRKRLDLTRPVPGRLPHARTCSVNRANCQHGRAPVAGTAAPAPWWLRCGPARRTGQAVPDRRCRLEVIHAFHGWTGSGP
ncbi:hypothetical protein [Nonomuraea rubra]|uniref:Uncharacterized protein n=1 Tax=Nonomuraea rubra TaxID=46180 RepID=A0A7X0U0V0_9ACTN|nr:hypothetical protein [Nonomuraea rubra]MBB6550918.1 hypothetical protein [Nonomuraea rubra]